MYDSENLAYSVIEAVLQMPEFIKLDCVMYASLATLVRDYSLLTEPEYRYASNPLTHIDFLIFNRMDRRPVLAIEVNGIAFHRAGSVQSKRDALKESVLRKSGISLLVLPTNGSGERERIIQTLRDVVNVT